MRYPLIIKLIAQQVGGVGEGLGGGGEGGCGETTAAAQYVTMLLRLFVHLNPPVIGRVLHVGAAANGAVSTCRSILGGIVGAE